MEARIKNLAEEAKRKGQQARELEDAAEDLSSRARRAKEAAMDSARAAYQLAQSKAKAGAKATDKAIQENPYSSLGIAFASGLLLGFLLKRR